MKVTSWNLKLCQFCQLPVLHSSPARTRSGQSDTSRYAIDGWHHWQPGQESARKFGMQRCPHIGIAAQQHVDMLPVVWFSSLHLCPVQEWFRHEALVCGCLITREKKTENASGSGQAQSTFLFYPFFIWFNSVRTTFAPPKRRAPSRLTPPTFPNNLGNILDRGPLHLRRTCTTRYKPGPSRALHQLFLNRRVKFYMP